MRHTACPYARRARARIATLALAALATVGVCAQAHAQRGFTLDSYDAPETSRDGFAISRPDAMGHLRLGAQLTLEYANDVLVLEGRVGAPDSELQQVVAHQLVGHIGVALGLIDRLVVFMGLPVIFLIDGDDPAALGGAKAQGAGLGDLSVGARVRLVGGADSTFGLAFQTTLHAPTARGDLFNGDATVYLHPELLAELRFGPLRLGLELGARLLRSEVSYFGAEIGNDLTFGLGVTVALIEGDTALDLHVEGFGHSGRAIGDREVTPIELLTGVKAHFASGVSAGLAGSMGIARGIGSPDVRVIATVGFMSTDGPQAPAPLPDRDGDGLLDAVDSCPDAPEDVDGFDDDDGCPEGDNDVDSILDPDDQCPNEPEDIDGFEDDDGCPDPDNDEDGVLDVDDDCPNIAEDLDGILDEDGCPEDDADKDTVLDPDDKCPLTPGLTVAEAAEGCGGCPKLACKSATGTIEILKRVEFASGKDVILKRSEPVLIDVFAILSSNTTLRAVRIEGHTDSLSNDAYNLDLSKRRARSVGRWLVARGLDPARLQTWGCGELHAIADNRRGRGRQKNRRVEFHIVDPAPPQGARSLPGCEQLAL